jgi:TRAP transporter TAXI family solute receptor
MFGKILSAAVLAALALAGPLPARAEKILITIGTGGAEGTYYPTGGAIAKLLTEKLPGVDATAQTTGASIQNCQLLGSKQIEMGMTTSDVAFQALKGQEPFKNPLPLAGLFSLYASEMQLVTTERTGIKTVADLKGKRVSLGPPGGGAMVLGEAILREFGLWDDVSKQFLAFGQSTSAIKDGNLDAAFIYAPSPAPAIIDLASSEKIVIVPVETEKMASITAKYPYFIQGVIPAGMYKGVEKDVPIAVCLSIMAVRTDMPETLAYDITKTVFTNLDFLRNVHRTMQQNTPENALRLPIPMHPGAARYFKEIGVIK